MTTNTVRRRNFLKAGAAATAAGALIPREAGPQTPAASSRSPLLAGANSYAEKLTAASGVPSNIPQRPGPPISIDVHCHWAPEVYLKAKADLGRPDFISPTNHDLVLRAKWMDEHGEQMQVLTLGGFMPWQWVTPEQGVHIAQITNDAAMQAHADYPTRFSFGIELPAGYPDGSLKELNRVAGKPGMVMVHLPNSLASREYLFEPGFAPVLARIQELGIPIMIHPLDGEPNWYAGHRLADEYSGIDTNANATASLFPGLTNSIGETFEQATTMAKFIVTGTLDKYPDLKLVIAHAGGAFPYVVGRLDRGGGGGRLKQPVHAYLRRFYYDNLAWYPLSLQYLIDLVGSDRVVLGTDNMGGTPNGGGGGRGQNGAAGQNAGGAPNGGGGGRAQNGAAGPNAGAAPAAAVAGPHSVIDQLNISREDRDLILRGNVKRLLNL
jgi:aminocarboxymuconate-semialdehyde decarboxylase